jgi:peptide/nickel transport system substrate-binding protein
MRILPSAVVAALSLALFIIGGCSPNPPPTPAERGDSSAEDSGSGTGSDSSSGGKSSTAEAENPAEEQADAGPFKLGNLIEPFTPPSLEEIDKTAEWKDNPVLDGLVLLREKLEKEKPLVTVAEALKLRNTSVEDNEKILSGLGRYPETDADVDWEANINRHSAGDVNSTNPLLISSTVEFDVSSLIGFGLFGFDWNFNNFGSKESIVSWQTSKDGLYDKVVMRDDLTWSDGKPITAHDVEFSFKVIMTSAVPIPAVRQGTNQLKWVQAYDDRTVVFFHKESLATNQQNINFPIIPKHVYEDSLPEDPTMTRNKKHVALEDNPVVGGPYIFKSRKRGSEIVLERRESYYMHNGKQVRDKPYFKTVRFRISSDPSVALLRLKAGDVDEMILSPEMWQTQTNDDEFYRRNTKVFATEWTEFHFVWNTKDPRFSDKRVRQALSYAFDHDELLQTLLYGMCEPCTGPYHPTSKWAPKPAPKPYKQDLDRAEELLDEAGWGDSNNDGIRDKMINGKRVDFDFTILTSNIPDRVKIAQLLAESLDRIGIKCRVSTLEFAALVDKLHKKDFQAAFGGWGSGTDPDSTENIFSSTAERNYGSYSNPEVDELFILGRKELDPEKRQAIYQKIHNILWEDQPYTWLYYRNAFYGFNKSLRGYYFSPRGPFHYSPGFSSIYKPAAQ